MVSVECALRLAEAAINIPSAINTGGPSTEALGAPVAI